MNNEIINVNLYNKYKELKEFQNFEYFKSGKCANIYKKDDILLKIYNSHCKSQYYLKKKVFNLLKELNISNIATLYEYYYLYDKMNNFVPMDAYTMKYIENDNINILDQPKEYLIDTVRNLEDTCLKLADNRIKMHDVHANNVILNNNGPTLIDVDTYNLYKLSSFKKIYLNNKLELLNFLKSRIKKDIKLKQIEFAFYKLDYLLRLNNDSQTVTDIVKQVFVDDTVSESLLNRLN